MGFWNVSFFWCGLGMYPCFDGIWEWILLLIRFGNVPLLSILIGFFECIPAFIGFANVSLFDGVRECILVLMRFGNVSLFWLGLRMNSLFNKVWQCTFILMGFGMYPCFDGNWEYILVLIRVVMYLCFERVWECILVLMGFENDRILFLAMYPYFDEVKNVSLLW